MRHIAMQRTTTINWAVSCPYCNFKNIRLPHIIDALIELKMHIMENHPRAVDNWTQMHRAKEQLALHFPGAETE